MYATIKESHALFHKTPNFRGLVYTHTRTHTHTHTHTHTYIYIYI